MYSEVTLNEHLNDFRGGLFNVKYKLYRFLGSLCFLRDFLVSLLWLWRLDYYLLYYGFSYFIC